jgi:hypothetical protein
VSPIYPKQQTLVSASGTQVRNKLREACRKWRAGPMERIVKTMMNEEAMGGLDPRRGAKKPSLENESVLGLRGRRAGASVWDVLA